MGKDNIFTRIGKAISGDQKSYNSDEQGWYDLTGTKLGNVDWDESNLLSQYGKSVYVFRAVKLIAESVSSIEYDLYRVLNTKGDVAEVAQHESLDLLARPNRFQTWNQLIKITSTNKSLAGEAFLYKVRDKRGRVVELWNLRPDLVTPVKGDSNNWIKSYTMRTVEGDVTFAVEDIIHLFDVNPADNRAAISALFTAKDRVQVEEFANQWQRDFFLNSARPDAILKTPESFGDTQKAEMRRDWNNKFQGRGKNSRIAFLEGGAEYQVVSANQKEMDFIASMKFTRDDILTAYGVPKALLVAEESNYAHANMAMLSFNQLTINPEAKQLFEALNEQLIKPDFGEEYFIEYHSPIPEQRELLLTEIEKGVDKWITRNEARQLLGYEPIDGADELYNEFSKVPISVSNSNDSLKLNSVKSGMRVFRGNRKLYKHLEFQESITKAVTAAVSKAVKNHTKDDAPAEPERISLLPNNQAKGQYYDLINKTIDRRASGFRQQLGEMFDSQERRIAEKLDEIKKVAENSTITVDKIKDILRLTDEVKAFANVAQPVYEAVALDAGQQANNFIESAKAAPDFKITAVLQQILELRAQFFAESVTETTFDRLADEIVNGINEGEGTPELTNRVSSVYSDISKSRAELIARTESTFASNAGFQEAYAESNVVSGKEWIATLDDRTRDEHARLHGEIVGERDQFSNGLSYPSEPNCRCVIAPAIIKA